MCKLAPNARPSVRTTYVVIVPPSVPGSVKHCPRLAFQHRNWSLFDKLKYTPNLKPYQGGEFRWESRQFCSKYRPVQFHQTLLGLGKLGWLFLGNAGWYLYAALDSKRDKATHQLKSPKTLMSNPSTVETPHSQSPTAAPSFVAFRMCIYKRRLWSRHEAFHQFSHMKGMMQHHSTNTPTPIPLHGRDCWNSVKYFHKIIEEKGSVFIITQLRNMQFEITGWDRNIVIPAKVCFFFLLDIRRHLLQIWAEAYTAELLTF